MHTLSCLYTFVSIHKTVIMYIWCTVCKYVCIYDIMQESITFAVMNKEWFEVGQKPTTGWKP